MWEKYVRKMYMVKASCNERSKDDVAKGILTEGGDETKTNPPEPRVRYGKH